MSVRQNNSPTLRTGFCEYDAPQVVSAKYFSSSGFRSLHQFLGDNNLLPQNKGGRSICTV